MPCNHPTPEWHTMGLRGIPSATIDIQALPERPPADLRKKPGVCGRSFRNSLSMSSLQSKRPQIPCAGLRTLIRNGTVPYLFTWKRVLPVAK